MPIPVINYAAMQPQGNPLWASILPAIMEGLKLGAMPKAIQQESRGNELQNALRAIQAQYQPKLNEAEIAQRGAQTNLLGEQTKYFGPNIQSEMNLRNAQIPLVNAQTANTQLEANNPLLHASGAAGQIGAMLYLKAHPELANKVNAGQIGQDNPDLSQMIQDALTANIKEKNAFAGLADKKSDAYNYQTLPASHKQYLLSQAAALGIDPQEATQRFINGESIKDMALSVGVDPRKLPNPNYPATPADISRQHQREQAMAEINTLQPILSEAMAPYARKTDGYSPKQIAEALGGTNPEAQAKFIAARALMPELSSLRIKALGGQVGVEAMKEVQSASLGHTKVFESLVSPAVYKRANELVDQWITLSVSKANRIGGTSGATDNLKLSDEDIQKLKKAGVGTKDTEGLGTDPLGLI